MLDNDITAADETSQPLEKTKLGRRHRDSTTNIVKDISTQLKMDLLPQVLILLTYLI